MDPVSLANVLEALMLIGFASAWPFSIVRAYRGRTAVGTSPAFMIVVDIAYVCGISAHIVADDINYVLIFYLLDFFLVLAALCVYVRNRRLDAESSKRTFDFRYLGHQIRSDTDMESV